MSDEPPTFAETASAVAGEVLCGWLALVLLAELPALACVRAFGLPIPPRIAVLGFPETHPVAWVVVVALALGSGALGSALARRSVVLALAGAFLAAALATQAAHVVLIISSLCPPRPFPPSWLWPMGGWILLGELLLFGPILLARGVGGGPRAQSLLVTVAMACLTLGPVRLATSQATSWDAADQTVAWALFLLVLGGLCPLALAAADAALVGRRRGGLRGGLGAIARGLASPLRRALRVPRPRRLWRSLCARLWLATAPAVRPAALAVAAGCAAVLGVALATELLGGVPRFGPRLAATLDAPPWCADQSAVVAASVASGGVLLVLPLAFVLVRRRPATWTLLLVLGLLAGSLVATIGLAERSPQIGLPAGATIGVWSVYLALIPFMARIVPPAITAALLLLGWLVAALG